MPPPAATNTNREQGWGPPPFVVRVRKKTLEPGWYIGKISVFGAGVTPAWKKVCPSANFLVKYTKKETDNALDGNSALELATHNYGRDEWWVLWLVLDPGSRPQSEG